MKKQTVAYKIAMLPEQLQQEVYDFIEFLTMKYLEVGKEENFDLSPESRDDNEELSNELKAFLDKRIASHKANPEGASKAEDFLEEIRKKYGFKL